MAATGTEVALADDSRRHKAAITIQTLWRRIMAFRRVTNIRLWKWVTTRNAVKLQCMYRSRVARACRRSLEEHRALRRTLLQRNVEARKKTVLVELIQWRGQRCQTAAATIQQWWRAVQAGEFTDQRDKLAKVVRDAKKNRELIEAADDHEKLDGELSNSPKIGKSVSLRPPE